MRLPDSGQASPFPGRLSDHHTAQAKGCVWECLPSLPWCHTDLKVVCVCLVAAGRNHMQSTLQSKDQHSVEHTACAPSWMFVWLCSNPPASISRMLGSQVATLDFEQKCSDSPNERRRTKVSSCIETDKVSASRSSPAEEEADQGSTECIQKLNVCHIVAFILTNLSNGFLGPSRQ